MPTSTPTPTPIDQEDEKEEETYDNVLEEELQVNQV